MKGYCSTRLIGVWSLIYVVVALLLAAWPPEASAVEICPKNTKQARQIKAQCGRSDYFSRFTTNRRPDQHNRISGGRDAGMNEFPSFVSIIIQPNMYTEMLCSGVLIDTDMVLTAAHCLDHKYIHAIKVGIGITNPKYWDSSGTRIIEGATYCGSPKWTGRPRILYDYAVIRLREPVELSQSVQTACLPDYPVGPETQAYTVGVGVVNDMHQMPYVAQVLPVSRIQCDWRTEHRTHICFQANQDNYVGDSCIGDSGGPIYVNEGGKMTVVGLTSFGLTDKCTNGFSFASINSDVYNEKQHVLELVTNCQFGGNILRGSDNDDSSEYDDDDDDDDDDNIDD